MIPITNSSIPAKVTVTTTAATLKALIGVTIPAGVNAVEVYADGGDIRYTMNEDLTPSATTGFVLANGQTRIFEGLDASQLKFYASTVVMQIQLGKIA